MCAHRIKEATADTLLPKQAGGDREKMSTHEMRGAFNKSTEGLPSSPLAPPLLDKLAHREHQCSERAAND